MNLPNISVLIPALNEEDYISQCLNSIISGNYPVSHLEVLVIDGGSSDRTAEITTDIAQQYPNIKLIKNPKKIVPAALNLGVTESKNDILIWLGAHTNYDSNYILKSVLTLIETQAASVGGVLTSKGRNPFSKALAFATSTKLGVGNAKYRYSKHHQSVDTVFGGCWYKKSIIMAGGFDEKWIRNQDFEFNFRLRKQVGEIILNPEIKASYFVRETPAALIKQYFQYGFWRFKTTQRHPKSISMRQLLPVSLVIKLAASFIIFPFSPFLGSLIPLIYVSVMIVAGIYFAISQKKWQYTFLLPFIYMALHISWGVGFNYSLIVSIKKKIERKLKYYFNRKKT